MSQLILFNLICKANNFEEADTILGNALKDNSNIQLHGDVAEIGIGYYSESASLQVEIIENLELKISSKLSNKDIIIDNIEVE